MVKLPSFDPVEYLIHRKYGIAHDSAGMQINVSAERLARKAPGLAAKVAAYRKELLQLSPKELNAKVEAERVAEAERDEQQRFFNQPESDADFAHWSKAAHWTLDEAIALSFGKAPEQVTWKNVSPYAQKSAFAFQYQRRWDLARRGFSLEAAIRPCSSRYLLGMG